MKSRTLIGSAVELIDAIGSSDRVASGVFVLNKPAQAVNVKKVDISISRVRVFNLFLFKIGSWLQARYFCLIVARKVVP